MAWLTKDDAHKILEERTSRVEYYTRQAEDDSGQEYEYKYRRRVTTTTERYPALDEDAAEELRAELSADIRVTASMARQNDAGAYQVTSVLDVATPWRLVSKIKVEQD